MVETNIRREELEAIRYSCESHARESNQDANLGGYCGIASYCIRVWYQFKPIINYGYFDIKSNPHCWVTINGHIIDITATQFDIKEKIIFDKKEKWSHLYYRTRTMKSYYDFRLWPEYQIPSPSKVEKILTRAKTYLP